MRRHPTGPFLASVFLLTSATIRLTRGPSAQPQSASPVTLQNARSSPEDLAVGGQLAGVARSATRYITRNALLALPQVTYTVTDDANFTGPTEVSGVLLEELVRDLAAPPRADLVVAICGDQYRATYPSAYLAAHHPLLVLKINGQAPSGWPKDAAGHDLSMGPYMISHPKFAPAFKILAHLDEPQIPWGVVQLDFRNARTVFRAIAPRGPHANQPAVQAGYRIAQQNCFRCHNMGAEGGHKAGRPWLVLSAWATASPEYFAAYVRNPRSKNPHAEMPGTPAYDDVTLAALRTYFQTFTSPENP